MQGFSCYNLLFRGLSLLILSVPLIPLLRDISSRRYIFGFQFASHFNRLPIISLICSFQSNFTIRNLFSL